MAPVYEIEWRKPLPAEIDESGKKVPQDDRVIRTRQTGSTAERAVENALAAPGGVMPYEVEGYGKPTVREVDEDGNLLPPSN